MVHRLAAALDIAPKLHTVFHGAPARIPGGRLRPPTLTHATQEPAMSRNVAGIFADIDAFDPDSSSPT
jgi:hypothetical protein